MAKLSPLFFILVIGCASQPKQETQSVFLNITTSDSITTDKKKLNLTVRITNNGQKPIAFMREDFSQTSSLFNFWILFIKHKDSGSVRFTKGGEIFRSLYKATDYQIIEPSKSVEDSYKVNFKNLKIINIDSTESEKKIITRKAPYGYYKLFLLYYDYESSHPNSISEAIYSNELTVYYKPD